MKGLRLHLMTWFNMLRIVPFQHMEHTSYCVYVFLMAVVIKSQTGPDAGAILLVIGLSIGRMSTRDLSSSPIWSHK